MKYCYDRLFQLFWCSSLLERRPADLVYFSYHLFSPYFIISHTTPSLPRLLLFFKRCTALLTSSSSLSSPVYPCISMYISVSQKMKALRYNLPSHFKFPQCMICPQKKGVEFLYHRWSKLEKLQAPKARSCDCRRQEAPYD